MSPHWKSRFRSAWWIGSFIAIIGLASELARGEQEAADGDNESRERLVMLISGRILSGQVSRNGGGYLVEQPNGRVQVPVGDVKFIVSDLREGYRKHRDSVVHPTPASHFSLANWCISHRLHDEARDELKKCLKADPENDEARRLLQRLTDTMRASLPPAATTPAPLKTSDGFLQPDVESLGGLSRDTATQFTSRIQPLLLNKCGNASCHGTAAENDFRLISARAGGNGSRKNSERNLAETMRYIDLQDVDGSQLLGVFRKGHGGKGTILVGSAGAEQLKQLKAWAQTVAQEKQSVTRNREDSPFVARNNKSKNSKKAVAHSIDVNDLQLELASGELSDDESLPLVRKETRPRELKSEPTDAEAMPALKPYDPFDPELFNRRPCRP